jgi:hypothetical protein
METFDFLLCHGFHQFLHRRDDHQQHTGCGLLRFL